MNKILFSKISLQKENLLQKFYLPKIFEHEQGKRAYIFNIPPIEDLILSTKENSYEQVQEKIEINGSSLLKIYRTEILKSPRNENV